MCFFCGWPWPDLTEIQFWYGVVALLAMQWGLCLMLVTVFLLCKSKPIDDEGEFHQEVAE